MDARARRPMVSAHVHQGTAGLELENEDVRADFIKTLRFWLDHGADGFRVDVAHGLAKDLDRDDLDDYVVWCTNDQPKTAPIR